MEVRGNLPEASATRSDSAVMGRSWPVIFTTGSSSISGNWLGLRAGKRGPTSVRASFQSSNFNQRTKPPRRSNAFPRIDIFSHNFWLEHITLLPS